MNTPNQKELLKEKIIALENKQAQDLETLKNQYQATVDGFKPLNLIKNSILEVATSPNLTSYLISGAIGMGTNYLKKTFLNENDTNPIKKGIGKVVKFALNRFVVKLSSSLNDIANLSQCSYNRKYSFGFFILFF